MTHTLQQLIYGKIVHAEQASTEWHILAQSGAWSESEPGELRQQIALAPRNAPDAPQSRALALVRRPASTADSDAPDQYLWVRTEWQMGSEDLPVIQFIALQGEQLRYGWRGLEALVDEEIPVYATSDNAIAPLTMNQSTPSVAQRRAAIERLLKHLPAQHIGQGLALLNAALDPRGLLIRNAPPDLALRMDLIEGLTLLLPQAARSALSFSTYSLSIPAQTPGILFSEAEGSGGRFVFDWAEPRLPDELGTGRYWSHLASLWQIYSDAEAFVARLEELDDLAEWFLPDQDLIAGLSEVAHRHNLDLAVKQGDETILIEALISVLQSTHPPQGELYQKYIASTLRLSLEERNTTAIQIITHAIDKDPALEEAMAGIFEQALETQPDSVYVFARVRLGEETSQKWSTLLHEAAEHSLDIAISSSDTTTLSNWLRLISREPVRYGLGPVLNAGILASRERAVEDGDLARELIIIAVKRDPNALDVLLGMTELLDVLPEAERAALRDFDSAAIESLAESNRETFLLAQARAAEAGRRCLTPTIIKQTWDLHTSQAATNVLPYYRPYNLIKLIVTADPPCLYDNALETLLALMLAEGDDDIFQGLAPSLSERENVTQLLAAILRQSGRPIADLLTLTGQLITEGLLSNQQATEVFTQLLTELDWTPETLDLVEQLARLLNQFAEVQIGSSSLWKMLDLAAETRTELLVRVATRRVLMELAEIAVEAQLVEQLARLRKVTSWNAQARSLIMSWWRSFAQNLPIGSLQKLDRALEGKRHLEDMRHVIQTTLALRRIIGQRSLSDFAQDISTAYTILQAMSDAFDPTSKQTVTVDIAMLRSLIDAQQGDLQQDARHVLAANLRELVQIITSLADKRSKPSLIRSDEVLDRQLVSGEVAPQSAIDVLKWLSGYLEGSHNGEGDT